MVKVKKQSKHKIGSKRPALNSAEFNMREIAKQFLLLEDHLSDSDKFCKDCIRKHLMLIEGFAEESVTLEPKSVWVSYARRFARASRDWMEQFTDGVDRHVLSQKVRVERKKLVQKVYDPRFNG